MLIKKSLFIWSQTFLFHFMKKNWWIFQMIVQKRFICWLIYHNKQVLGMKFVTSCPDTLWWLCFCPLVEVFVLSRRCVFCFKCEVFPVCSWSVVSKVVLSWLCCLIALVSLWLFLLYVFLLWHFVLITRLFPSSTVSVCSFSCFFWKKIKSKKKKFRKSCRSV